MRSAGIDGWNDGGPTNDESGVAVTEAVTVCLPVPPYALSKNGRVHPIERNRLYQQHKFEAVYRLNTAMNWQGYGWKVHSYAEMVYLEHLNRVPQRCLTTLERDDGRVSSDVDEVYQAPLFPRTGRWTSKENELFLSLYQTHTYQVIAAILGRSPGAVRSHRYELQLECKDDPDWTDAELARLVTWIEERVGLPAPIDEIAEELGRSYAAVALKISRLGHGDRNRWRVDRINGRVPSEVPKYESPEAMKQAFSERLKRRWLDPEYRRRRSEHVSPPISEETRRKISAAARRYNQSVTFEQRSQRQKKAALTRLERYGYAGPKYVMTENAYSRAKRGTREDLGFFVRSMWEANYARYLKWLKEQNQIADWEYEPETFVFHGVTRNPLTYTPDFKVTELDGSVVYHEVKGWMDPKSKSKLKRMAKFYPDIKIIVVGEDSYYDIARKVGPAIEHWERNESPREAKRKRW